MGPWTQLWVKAPEGNGYQTPESIKRIDDHLTQQTAACFNAPDGAPVREADGTYEVRVLAGDPGYVKFILTEHYRLEIVREIVND